MQPMVDKTINVPAFLGKLWKMVNDPATDHLICWNVNGNSFAIQNQAQFWYELLPLYYKHNNMSSFVRQLNMYGFHKVTSVENGTMDSDKDEITFYHPFFRKDDVELLKNIKRKVTGPKHTENASSRAVIKSDDMTQVLTDVKQIRIRQSSVDSQLSAIKEENSILWSELANLRQKHVKQQQIVNKLIQFLVTLVQPRMNHNNHNHNVGVKREYPLMLRESPSKRSKDKSTTNTPTEGPTIHELDSELDIPEVLYEEMEEQNSPLINSPQTPNYMSGSGASPSQSQSATLPSSIEEPLTDPISPTIFWDKPDLVQPEDYLVASGEENIINSLHNDLNESSSEVNEKIFLNPNSQNTLLSNYMNGSYNINALNHSKIAASENSKKKGKKETNEKTPLPTDNRLVSTRDVPRINHGEDLDFHVESTQSELDQLKDLLQGCNSFDANALLGVSALMGLFSDELPEYGLSFSQDKEHGADAKAGTDPMVSGSELTTYGMNMIDFNELFDNTIKDSIDDKVTVVQKEVEKGSSDSIETPQIKFSEPVFPSGI